MSRKNLSNDFSIVVKFSGYLFIYKDMNAIEFWTRSVNLFSKTRDSKTDRQTDKQTNW